MDLAKEPSSCTEFCASLWAQSTSIGASFGSLHVISPKVRRVDDLCDYCAGGMVDAETVEPPALEYYSGPPGGSRRSKLSPARTRRFATDRAPPSRRPRVLSPSRSRDRVRLLADAGLSDSPTNATLGQPIRGPLAGSRFRETSRLSMGRVVPRKPNPLRARALRPRVEIGQLRGAHRTPT